MNRMQLDVDSGVHSRPSAQCQGKHEVIQGVESVIADETDETVLGYSFIE